MKPVNLTHRFAWKNNEKRRTLYGRACRIVACGALGSILIEFENGQREIVSRRAVRAMRGTQVRRRLRHCRYEQKS